MDALVNHQMLTSDFVYRSRAEFEKKEGVTLVTLGAMNQDTFDDMKPLFNKPKIYIELFMRFAGRIIGSDSRTSYDYGSGSESDSDSDDEEKRTIHLFGSADPPLHQKIYEKLESAANALGKCLSQSQVVNAYPGRRDDEHKDLDSATRLARFVRSCYYNRFRERLVAFLERQSRCDAIQIQIRHMDDTQEEKEYHLNTIEANKTKMLESIEEHLRAIKRNLRAMEIKSRIHELVRIADGWDGWGKMSTKDDKASALESYTGRVNGLCKTFVEFTENEVTRFIGELIEAERRSVIGTQIIDLIRHLEHYTVSRGSELMDKARYVTAKVEDAIESAKREEEEMAREAARNDTDGGSDEPSGLEAIMRHYSGTVIPELNRLSVQAQNTKAPKRRRVSSRAGMHDAHLASGSSIQQTAELLLHHTSALEAEVSAYKTMVGSVSNKAELDRLVIQAIDICNNHLFRAMDELATLVRLVIVWFRNRHRKKTGETDEEYAEGFIGMIRSFDSTNNKSFLLYDLMQSDEIDVLTKGRFETLLEKYKKGGEGASVMDSIMKSAKGVFARQIHARNTNGSIAHLIFEKELNDYWIHLYQNTGSQSVLNEFDKKLRKITDVVLSVFPGLTHNALIGAFNIPDFSRDAYYAVADMSFKNQWLDIKIKLENIKGSDPLQNLNGFMSTVKHVTVFIDELIQLLKSDVRNLTPERYKKLKEPIDGMVVYLENAYDLLKQKVDTRHEAHVKSIDKEFKDIMRTIKEKVEEVNLAEKHMSFTTHVFGRNQTHRQHGTRFGRYVHRVAKHSARVPHRAWSA
jgi:hypothetical protein